MENKVENCDLGLRFRVLGVAPPILDLRSLDLEAYSFVSRWEVRGSQT